MGLRFRKSITLCKGVKLNFGKAGVSVTTGIPGFHETINLNTGKRTTSIGIPGSGIYYTTSSGGNKQNVSGGPTFNSIQRNNSATEQITTASSHVETRPSSEDCVFDNTSHKAKDTIHRITHAEIRDIYRLSDEKIDWFKLLANRTPTDSFFDKEMWAYFHSIALQICQGNIDTYLKVIADINPFDDLLDYIENVECGDNGDDALHISFHMRSDIAVVEDDYELLMSACVIRIARDSFALLPIETVDIESENNNGDNLKTTIDYREFSKINFAYSDPRIIVKHFQKR